MKILITEPVHPSGVAYLEDQGVTVDCKYGLARDVLLDIVGEYDALIIRSDTHINEELLAKCPELKAVGMAGIGLNHIDLDLCKARDIGIFNVPEGSIESVAELALGFFIAAARNIVKASRDTRNGKWDKSGYMGHTLEGKTLGILALGKIGSRVAELVKPLGMQVLAYDPFITEEQAKSRGAKLVSLEELLKTSDFVSIHTPLTEATYHLIGKDEIDLMKDTAFLFNLGRGGVIDEDALYEALVTGKIKAAALDVMEVEPAPQSRLFELDNVFITPHIGAGTVESQKYIAETIAHKVLEHLRKS